MSEKEINIRFVYEVREGDEDPEETASKLAYEIWCELGEKEYKPKYYNYTVDEIGEYEV